MREDTRHKDRCGRNACSRWALCVVTVISISILVVSLTHARTDLTVAKAKITALEMKNAGLEARITKEALRAYCRVECGSCIPLESVYAALTHSRGRQ